MDMMDRTRETLEDTSSTEQVHNVREKAATTTGRTDRMYCNGRSGTWNGVPLNLTLLYERVTFA